MWVNAILPIAEMCQHVAKYIYLTMDVADNVEGTGEQRLY
jgi:hypothetical protein